MPGPVGERLKRPSCLAATAAFALLLAGCSTGTTETTDPDTEPEATASPTQDPNDDFQSLQVNMVAQSGTHFPDGVDGMTFGCSDTLVTIDTVPTEAESTEEHVGAAVEFLLDDSQYYHGDPPVTNSLTLSETLELSGVELDRNAVHLELTGEPVVQSECEAYRIQAQLYGTAASTAGVEEVSISVEGTELDDVLNVESFDTSQLFSPEGAD